MRARDQVTLTTLHAARRFIEEYGRRIPGVLASDLPSRLDDIISTANAPVAAQAAHELSVDSLVEVQATLCTAIG